MKIKDWIKENWIFLGIILFALIIRIYYFVLTNGQVLWWDEAEYMNMARVFAFGGDYNFGPVRPILFSLISAVSLKFLNTEILPRLFILILSLASVIGIYYLGKELYNKTVGLVSSFLMSIFYLGLFFTYRLLVDLPSLTFFIFSALFFFKYFKTKTGKFLYLASFILAIGTLFKLSTAFILVPCLIYLLVTERLNFLKKKEIWIAAAIFVITLLPYIIWGYSEFGGFVLTQASSHVAPESYLNGFGILMNYLKLFPTYFSWSILMAFIFGLFLMYKVVLYFDLLIKGDTKLKQDFFLILIFLIPLILISMLINHNENRYIMIVFPIVLIISSSFIEKAYGFLKEKNKIIAVILLGILFFFAASYQIKTADALIKNKETSYLDVRTAGLWLKDNSDNSDIIITKSQPQIRFYSERRTIGIPPTEEEFEQSLTNETKFFIVSIFENHPEWAYSYPNRKNLTLAQAYMIPENQPVLVIYNLK